MNQEWQQFLTQQGAIIEGDIVQRFADTSAELLSTSQGSVLCTLSQFGTLRASGDDAQSFLQNLLSNDIREVDGAHAQLSSFNTPKGRMLASMMIRRNGDDYLLQLPRVLCEPMRKKLSMYVLRSKVKIADASDEVISLGLSGPNAQEVLSGQFGELPQEQLGVARADAESPSIIRIGDTRFQVDANVQQAQALWQAASQHAQPVGSVCWDWLSIRAGIPVILPQTQEQFVPQMVNYDGIGGVSFKKGCYPGQEIVARMQYLGHLKRRMYLAHIDVGAHVDADEIPQAGDELFSADMEGQATGMIVNAAPAPGGGSDVLAVVQIASRETQAIHWKSLQGAALQFLPTPFLPPKA